MAPFKLIRGIKGSYYSGITTPMLTNRTRYGLLCGVKKENSFDGNRYITMKRNGYLDGWIDNIESPRVKLSRVVTQGEVVGRRAKKGRYPMNHRYRPRDGLGGLLATWNSKTLTRWPRD